MTPWWRGAVFYQIYPRSFLDTDGDGVGDLEGIRRRLPYLAELGVDALWLSPFYPSPMKDYGYDVADYCEVDPLFGTLADFDALVADAHARGLRVIIDFVPNHSSSDHPWFKDARSSRDAPHRDWYVWRDGVADERPNGWYAMFGGRAWTWDEGTQQWYLHLFLPEQPDLDWRNPEVAAAMHGALRFWLDRGVDGFRIDVVHFVGKDVPLGPDVAPPGPAPYTHEVLRDVRRLLDSYPGHRTTVGEVYIMETDVVAEFYGDHDELHMAFNFPPLYAPWDAGAWRERIDEVIAAFDPIGAWPTWVLSNHDNPRHRTRYGGGEAAARAACLLLLGLRGTPFLYAGEELGLSDAFVPEHRRVDPIDRDGCRAPMPWDGSPTHGWATADPWLPWPPDADTLHAEAQVGTDGSFLELYRRALGVRRGSAALRTGSFGWLPSPPDVLAWERSAGGERVIAAVNMGDEPVDLGDLGLGLGAEVLGLGAEVLVESAPGTFPRLPGSAAVWLRSSLGGGGPVDRR